MHITRTTEPVSGQIKRILLLNKKALSLCWDHFYNGKVQKQDCFVDAH